MFDAVLQINTHYTAAEHLQETIDSQIAVVLRMDSVDVASISSVRCAFKVSSFVIDRKKRMQSN